MHILYNFIVSKKINKTRIAVIILIALILAGIGIGCALIGIKDFEYIEEYNIVNDKYTFEMSENLGIISWNDETEYIENNSNEVTIIVKHSNHYNTKYYINNEKLHFHCYHDDSKMFEIINNTIEDLKNKKIVNYDKIKIYVYSSKENIKKIKENSKDEGGLILTNPINEDDGLILTNTLEETEE